MKYFSTNKQSPEIDFKEATIKGQAPDKGLYFPEEIPLVEKKFIENISDFSNEEIAFRVIKPYVGTTIPEEKLFQIVSETVNFPIPLVKVSDRISSLELFHGPTLAFKDIGARFMSRCLGYFVKGDSRKVTVLVATSGDTGGAVANGFYDVDGVEVVILYPSGKVSPVQEKQLTTLGKNITALEVQGTFDDCQSVVKQAFTDKDINDKLFLTSANSINVARWLPQQFYYFFAYKQWINSPLGDGGNPPVISVPSGNFGNICAGILAMQSGLPVKHFIAACNMNDIVSDYLQTEVLTPKQAVATLSNAMDVGNPSNYARIIDLYQNNIDLIKQDVSCYAFNDEQTLEAMSIIYKNTKYIMDPHGAVGYLGLNEYQQKNSKTTGIILETAHPAKFIDVVQSNESIKVSVPDALSSLSNKEKMVSVLSNSYHDFKTYLLNKV